MFEEIMEKFSDSPSQQRVIRLLLARGFSVNDEGRVVSGGIEIPNTGIARELDVDRRVVGATNGALLAHGQLPPLFPNIPPGPRPLGPPPGLDPPVPTVPGRGANETGILAAPPHLPASVPGGPSPGPPVPAPRRAPRLAS